MRKTMILAGFAAVLFSACSSVPKVNRIDADTVVDLSGRWNDSDVRIVCETLINDCLSSPRVALFIQQYTKEHDGKLPSCLVGSFTNTSSEHIDTSVISKRMEIAIVNSGRLDFVAGGEDLEALRTERDEQQSNASEDTAARLGYETGAILMLTGSVKAVIDQAGNRSVRAYFVNAELTNVETRTRLWMGENDEIKKDITQPRYRP
jgi:PBP1b-binding outer membrane lipoprotein LpoB